MSDYTPEQTKQLADYLSRRLGRMKPISDSGGLPATTMLNRDIAIILSALEAAQKERDMWRNTAKTQQECGDKLQAELITRPTTWAYEQACAALHKHEKERDALAAYAAKLEKAGDAMYGCSAVDFDKACVAWNAARKEKP